MKLKFCGATRTVTGSCFYIDTGSFKFLVDCGAFQGGDETEKLNYEPFPFDPGQLDAVFLTHAHFDHSGRIPSRSIWRLGFSSGLAPCRCCRSAIPRRGT